MSLRSFVTRGQSQAPRVEEAKPTPVHELLPWQVTDISYRPFDGFWSFNPSIHFDGQTWRCVLRCADYALPDSVEIRGPRARPNQVQTHNAMLILDPNGWQPVEIFAMQELDGLHRLDRCASLGYEDMRLFQTSDGALHGIAAALHLGRDAKIRANSNPPVEQVLLGFDDRYNIASATPLRGRAWEGKSQKNWTPFEGADVPCFLYAVERGIVMSVDAAGQVWPINDHSAAAFKIDQPIPKASRFASHGPEVRISKPFVPIVQQIGHTSPREYKGLRGGTQLVSIGDDRWLGIAHAMTYSDTRKKKYYWHHFYAVDDAGTLIAKSRAIKLALDGIEFAAGLAVDGDHVVISYGTDDMNCFIAETSLAAILELLPGLEPEPVAAEPEPAPAPELPPFVGGDIVAAGAAVAAASSAPLEDAVLERMDLVSLRRAYRALRDHGGAA